MPGPSRQEVKVPGTAGLPHATGQNQIHASNPACPAWAPPKRRQATSTGPGPPRPRCFPPPSLGKWCGGPIRRRAQPSGRGVRGKHARSATIFTHAVVFVAQKDHLTPSQRVPRQGPANGDIKISGPKPAKKVSILAHFPFAPPSTQLAARPLREDVLIISIQPVARQTTSRQPGRSEVNLWLLKST